MSSVALSFFLCYSVRMAVTKIADAKEDFDHWLETRTKFLSSSDVFTWREVFTKETDWWEDRRQDVIDVKMGIEKEFDDETVTSMLHGTYDEEHIMRKFGSMVDCEVEPENGLYTNDKWPMLSASIDGFGRPHAPELDPGKDLQPELCQDGALAQKIHDIIMAEGSDFILEIKKSTSVKWQTKCPDYYWTQVQTQLAILEAPYAIITAECIHKGRTQKWRMYWDQRAYVIRPEPSWLKVMDQLNQEALDSFGHLR